jgi:hypothetical protein
VHRMNDPGPSLSQIFELMNDSLCSAQNVANKGLLFERSAAEMSCELASAFLTLFTVYFVLIGRRYLYLSFDLITLFTFPQCHCGIGVEVITPSQPQWLESVPQSLTRRKRILL